MKKIKLNNGEIRNGYHYSELPKNIQDVVINDQINFEIEIMDENNPYYYLAEKMEKMETPWFLGECIYENHLNDLIETMEINLYLFDDEGNLLPITYHMNNNKLVKITFGKKEIECIIE